MTYTTQDIFDKVVLHMRAQGKPKQDNRGWGYINPDNPCERCAKGVLMNAIKTKAGYRRKNYRYRFIISPNTMEDILDTVILDIEDGINRKLTKKEIELLDYLEALFEEQPWRFRGAGTKLDNVNTWEEGFERLAHQFNLKYSKPSTLKPKTELLFTE